MIAFLPFGEPEFGVEFGGVFPDFEVEFSTVSFVGVANGADALFGGDFVVGAYRNSFEVGVYGEVVSVANNDCFAGAGDGDNSADRSFKYRACRRSLA